MLRIAHRGASGYEAENSLSAFKKAVAMGVDYIEADVQLSKDGVPIIRHDKLIDRTTDHEGYTWEHNYADFKAFIKLSNGETVLSLDELCAFVSTHDVKLYMDLKTFGSEELIIETCMKHLAVEDFIIGSFHSPTIKHVKHLNPNIQTVLIIEGNPIDMDIILDNSECDIVAFGFDSIDLASVEKVKARGKKVFTWTVNHPREIQRAKTFPIDGITSNFPDRI